MNYAVAVPKGFRLKQNIINEFEEQFQFKGSQWPKFNMWMVDALYHTIVDGEYVSENELDADARKIHLRCEKTISKLYLDFPKDYMVDHDVIFEIVNDFNWLLASERENERRKLTGRIQLSDNMVMLRKNTVKFLEWLQSQIDKDAEELPFMKEALSRKRKIIVGFPDDHIRWYIERTESAKDLEAWIQDTENRVREKRYLFYILMVTAVRFEYLKRRFE